MAELCARKHTPGDTNNTSSVLRQVRTENEQKMSPPFAQPQTICAVHAAQCCWYLCHRPTYLIVNGARLPSDVTEDSLKTCLNPFKSYLEVLGVYRAGPLR